VYLFFSAPKPAGPVRGDHPAILSWQDTTHTLCGQFPYTYLPLYPKPPLLFSYIPMLQMYLYHFLTMTQLLLSTLYSTLPTTLSSRRWVGMLFWWFDSAQPTTGYLQAACTEPPWLPLCCSLWCLPRSLLTVHRSRASCSYNLPAAGLSSTKPFSWLIS